VFLVASLPRVPSGRLNFSVVQAAQSTYRRSPCIRIQKCTHDARRKLTSVALLAKPPFPTSGDAWLHSRYSPLRCPFFLCSFITVLAAHFRCARPYRPDFSRASLMFSTALFFLPDSTQMLFVLHFGVLPVPRLPYVTPRSFVGLVRTIRDKPDPHIERNLPFSPQPCIPRRHSYRFRKGGGEPAKEEEGKGGALRRGERQG